MSMTRTSTEYQSPCHSKPFRDIPFLSSNTVQTHTIQNVDQCLCSKERIPHADASSEPAGTSTRDRSNRGSGGRAVSSPCGRTLSGSTQFEQSHDVVRLQRRPVKLPSVRRPGCPRRPRCPCRSSLIAHRCSWCTVPQFVLASQRCRQCCRCQKRTGADRCRS